MSVDDHEGRDTRDIAIKAMVMIKEHRIACDRRWSLLTKILGGIAIGVGIKVTIEIMRLIP